MRAFEWQRLYFRNGDGSLCETKATMAALATYADFDNLTCYPSQVTLAQDIGASVDTVRRHIRKNVEAGWIEVVEQGNSFKAATKYKLTTPCTGTGQLLAPLQPTPSTDARSTPSTGAALTTHTSIHRSIHETNHADGHWDPFGSPIEDPFEDGSSNGHVPLNPTNHVATPSTDARSTDCTDADITYRWPRDKPLPEMMDPFGVYADEETGEPFAHTPGELPTVASRS